MVDTQVADIRIYTTNMKKAWSVINEAKLLCPRKKYQRIECTYVCTYIRMCNCSLFTLVVSDKNDGLSEYLKGKLKRLIGGSAIISAHSIPIFHNTQTSPTKMLVAKKTILFIE